MYEHTILAEKKHYKLTNPTSLKQDVCVEKQKRDVL